MAITKVTRNLLSTGIDDQSNSTAITIDSSENVGIGTTSPSRLLETVATNAGADITALQVRNNNSSTSTSTSIRFVNSTSGTSTAGGAEISAIRNASDGGALTFKTAADSTATLTERVRIEAATNGIYAITSNSEKAGGILNASSATNSLRIWADPDNQRAATNMEFYVDATERMRITSTGHLHINGTTADAFHRIVNNTNGEWNTVFYSTASNPYGLYIGFTGAAPNNASNVFLNMNDTAAARAVFYSNGGLANYQSNDSNLSDEREKKNIEDLSSTWDCVKSWNIRKFHYNEDEDSDDKRLGVIAQEVETECPEVITEWKKQEQKDEVLWTEEDELPEGVSVGDVKTAAQEEVIRKGVKEQQMYWMAIKALQEAMTEIESLKSRIEILENA